MKSQSIVGFSNNRAQNDYYPTPSFATESLLQRIKFNGTILEPACGAGHISKILISNNFDVISNDLFDYGFGNTNIDFFEYADKVDNIITNPPYKLAEQFILHSKSLSKNKIAMLLKTVFLEGSKRQKMFLDKEFPLEYVLQFSKRLSLTRNGVEMKNKGMIAYAWFVWNKEYSGEPKIGWI